MNPQIARLAAREIEGPVPIGRVRSGIANGYGAENNTVWLSFDTLAKQLAHHPDIPLDFYESLDWLLLPGEILPNRRPNCFYVIQRTEQLGVSRYKATIKIVRANRRMMLLSVHKIDLRAYKRIVRLSNESKGPHTK